MNKNTAKTISIILGVVLILLGVVDLILFIKGIVDVVKLGYLSYLEGIAIVSYLASAIGFEYLAYSFIFLLAGIFAFWGYRKIISIIPAVVMILFELVHGIYALVSMASSMVSMGYSNIYVFPAIVQNIVVCLCNILGAIVIIVFIILSIKKVAKFIPFIAIVPIALSFISAIAPFVRLAYLSAKLGVEVSYLGGASNFFVTVIPITVWCVVIAVNYLAAAKEKERPAPIY